MTDDDNRVTIRGANIAEFVKLQQWLFVQGITWGNFSLSTRVYDEIPYGLVVIGIRMYNNPINFDNEAPNDAVFKIKVLKMLKARVLEDVESE